MSVWRELMCGLRRATPVMVVSTVMAVSTVLLGCTAGEPGIKSNAVFRVTVTAVDGNPLPSKEAPLPPNLGTITELWTFAAEALDSDGDLDTEFNGYARVSIEPGSILEVAGETSVGRNIKFDNGVASGVAHATAMFGPTRLWVEDVGYTPAPEGVTPTCANGDDDDDDVVIDYPSDPGCAFADDMSEEPGTLTTGVSNAVYYHRPSIADVQGRGSTTPYPAVAVDIKAGDPNYIVVTRVASAGFFVTDLGDAADGYNHLFAFNFNTPEGMRVCDRLTLLTGTAAEFFGFTEITFPSYEVDELVDTADCPLEEPPVLDGTDVSDPQVLERLESGVVRVEGFRISENLGPGLAVNNVFAPDATNCDLNGDGAVDFLTDDEGSCANVCASDPQCTEWTGFISRGNYKVQKDGVQIQLNTGTALGFSPQANLGQELRSVTGTLRNFSGGSLNWTIETRCIDDLLCDIPDAGCAEEELPINEACVTLRTEFDNDAGTN